MQYLLAHDLGTSGNKATLFSTDGRMIGSYTCPYDVFYDRPLWAEQDAEAWWHALCTSTKILLQQSGVKPDEVAAVSFSGQMMGCLPVNREGKPLRRAIIWADQRASEQAARLGEKIPLEKYYQICGHRNSASYGIQKAMWVRDHEPEIYEQTYKFLNAKDFMVLRLTGNWYTDCSDANSMTCFDQSLRNWSEEIVETSGIDPDKLPEVVESVHFAGYVTEEAANQTGLSTSTKVIVGAGDGVAANVGAGCVAPGKSYCSIGTSAWVASTSERPVLDDQMRIVCWAHAVPGLYSPNGTMQYAGGSYQWMKNTICLSEAAEAKRRMDDVSVYDLINEEIASSEPGADGLIFLPHLMGERAPRWNANAKGVFYGITPTTTRAQLLRSVMEGIILNLKLCYDILMRDRKTMDAEPMMLVGGAARSSEWQRCVANCFGTDVHVPALLEESTSMGAAVIAGVGSGIFKDFSAAEQFIQTAAIRQPEVQYAQAYRTLQRDTECLYQALLPVYNRQDQRR